MGSADESEQHESKPLHITIRHLVPLGRQYFYYGFCCQEWPLRMGYGPGRCGICGERPTFLRKGPVLDQRESPASVGYAALGGVSGLGSPIDPEVARRAYDEACKEDPWPGSTDA